MYVPIRMYVLKKTKDTCFNFLILFSFITLLGFVKQLFSLDQPSLQRASFRR